MSFNGGKAKGQESLNKMKNESWFQSFGFVLMPNQGRPSLGSEESLEKPTQRQKKGHQLRSSKNGGNGQGSPFPGAWENEPEAADFDAIAKDTSPGGHKVGDRVMGRK